MLRILWRDERLIDVPVDITAVGGATLSKYQVTRITDLATSMQDMFFWDEISSGQITEISAMASEWQRQDGAMLPIEMSIRMQQDKERTLAIVVAKDASSHKAVEDELEFRLRAIVPDIGALYRGESMQISTYLEKAAAHELSANVSDLCPVGALTNKVFRFRARPWELLARESIGYHDALGSNLYLHIRRGEVLRSVPRDNEAINENWLSDRDRYSHQGLTHGDRLTAPRIKRNGQWVDASWDEALKAAAEGLQVSVSRHGGDALAAFASPNASAEELYLFQAMARGLGGANIDHRLRQLDNSDDAAAPISPGFALPVAGYSDARAILLVGSHPRHDTPLLGHRIRSRPRQCAQGPIDQQHGELVTLD